jgi:hypothetical protein
MFARKLSHDVQHLAKPYAQAAVERSASALPLLTPLSLTFFGLRCPRFCDDG